MGHRQILTYLFLLALIPLSAKALPPPSPAGGNYLVLDGVDDYAVLDFETFGYLLPDGTDQLTFEAWIYPTTPPDNKSTSLTILHQQVRMIIVSDEFQPLLNNLANALNIEPPKGGLILLMSSYIEGALGRTLTFPIPLAPNQWHHIAYQLNEDQITMIVNDFVRTNQQGIPLGRDLGPHRPKDFVLGGFGKIIEEHVRPPDKWFWGSFTGYIDEVRISKDVRYDVNKKGFMPDGKFKKDAKTVALWHFDEPGGTQQFSDASGNAHHLVGKNGAKIGNALAIEAQEKLTTTWGRLKQ